ncbi:MAG: ABC transporter substrate-binding protein [Sedimentisphaerales bacterium]|nr:ABC transporter substrate-binding protein [Sedimentisphaerales bacterium]
MKTKKFYLWMPLVLVLLAASYVLWSDCGAKKQQKVYRVGVLSGLNYIADITDGFKEKMSELGYVEGRNILYDVQKTDVDINAYKSVLRKFINDKVDLIFVFPTEASIEAKIAVQGTNIPVVFANVFTEDTGLVNSVREPGGNITGVRWDGPDIALRGFDFIRQLVPKAKHIWIPYLKGYPIVKSQLDALRPAFAAEGLIMTEFPAENAAELEAALKKQVQLTGTPDALMALAEPLCVTPDSFVVLAAFADEHKIPFGGAYMSLGGHESIFGLKPLNIPQGKQAAFLADKILRGTPPGTLPVVTAENHLQISFRQAQKLGINVPEGLLSRADEVIH